MKEATIGPNERHDLEAIVSEAREATHRRLEHAVDCAYRQRGYRCTCVVGEVTGPAKGPAR